MAVGAHTAKAEVRDFWEAKPCCSAHAEAPEETKAYFEQVKRQRYQAEPSIPIPAKEPATRARRCQTRKPVDATLGAVGPKGSLLRVAPWGEF